MTEEQPYDDRHNTPPAQDNRPGREFEREPANPFYSGAMDRHAEVVGGQPIHVDRSRLAASVEAARTTQPAWPGAAPSPHLVPVPAEVMRSAIKEALTKLLLIDLANDEEDETYGKLRDIANGLIEAL